MHPLVETGGLLARSARGNRRRSGCSGWQGLRPFLAVLTVAAGLVWVLFAVSVLVEFAAGLRGRQAPRLALAGVLLHVMAHAAAKGNAFMGAGVLVRKFATKQTAALTGGLDLLPWSGPLFLAAILALSAMPPFGIFRSEFEIVAGGLSASRDTAAAILVVLVTVAFLGLSATTNKILLTPRREPGPARGEPSIWMVAPVLAGVIALLVLGLHPPGELLNVLDRALAALRGGA